MSRKEKAIRGRHYIKWIRAYIECLEFDRPVSMLNFIEGTRFSGGRENINHGLQLELGF